MTFQSIRSLSKILCAGVSDRYVSTYNTQTVEPTPAFVYSVVSVGLCDFSLWVEFCNIQFTTQHVRFGKPR